MVHAVHSVRAVRHAAAVAGLVHRDRRAVLRGARSGHRGGD